MSILGQTICSKCKQSLVCRPDDIQNCHCSQIQLSKETLQFLNDTYYDSCLCNECLQNLDHLVQKASKAELPESDQLVKGIHYTIENGLWVFTEYYHIQKGYCCNNKCKNCPYGYGR